MTKNITFTNTSGNSEIEKPKPSSAYIPEWYKNTESYVGGEKKPGGTGHTTATIKRCIPVFDALTSGYIIPSPADVFISEKDGQVIYEWSAVNLISFHPIAQAPEHPAKNDLPDYPKWMNPWSIQTPKGYSVFITQPVHRESVFKILDGVVDTDMYTAPINFPFVFIDSNFRGLIPQGTPIAQVIPFKRESWKMEFGSQQELEKNEKVIAKLHTQFFDKYKSMFWERKEYR